MEFTQKVSDLTTQYEALVTRKNTPLSDNGIVTRYVNPVLTAAHTPVFWRYDLDTKTNPLLCERIGINSVFNSGAIELDGKVYLVPRIEGPDRKSFFAVAQSDNGIDNFRFWDWPIEFAVAHEKEVNVYDMRLTRHEDGWIYGLFCAERHDDSQPNDQSAALARAGLVRTRDLKTWERLPDLKAPGLQHRNYVLHPEFVHGKYGLYTRPTADFKSTGTGSGIGWGLCDSMENVEIKSEVVVDPCVYHTITEGKNGQGPAPIKTAKGWLHLAHGVRDSAAGYRYVLYMFLTDLAEPWRITHQPAGYFMAPKGDERVGDVSNVLFANGWVARQDGQVLIYYGSSDTRLHVAASTVERLLDYVMNTPSDPVSWYNCLQQRKALIAKNLKLRDAGK